MALGAYKMSGHVRREPLDEVRVALWNPFFPSVALMDAEGASFLDSLEEVDLQQPEYAELLASLLQHRLIYTGDSDPYPAAFFDSVARQLARTELSAQALLDGSASYGNFYVTNSACNLGCSYCISAEGDKLRPAGAWGQGGRERKRRVALAALDQYLARKRALGDKDASLTFNGGEILLEWPLLREMLDFARGAYPELHLRCGMNSNLTRLTPEIAAGLDEFGVQVFTSLDGHREHHDLTRVDHAGRGSFDAVLHGIETFNRHARQPIRGFQGTIDRVEAFDPERFFALHELGFVEARLAPNLLHTTHTDAEAKAHLHADLFERGQSQNLLLTDTYFRAVHRVLEKAHDGFSFYCAGLSGLPHLVLTLNLDTCELSQLCTFVSPAARRFEELGEDIYARVLWDASRAYITRRLEQLREFCGGCDVLGVCRGGCIMNGLDLANNPNPPACTYQRVSFRRFLRFSHAGGTPEARRRELRVVAAD